MEVLCTQAFVIGSSILLGFEVDSLDETIASLKVKGIAQHGCPFQPVLSIRFILITDPNGLKVQFLEHIE
jgi:lactoylglutathione lyase